MNRAWHERHVMPKHPTVAQRIRWHVAHHKHCACRPIPSRIAALIRRRPGDRHAPPIRG
jgi:hypothetical protein